MTFIPAAHVTSKIAAHGNPLFFGLPCAKSCTYRHTSIIAHVCVNICSPSAIVTSVGTSTTTNCQIRMYRRSSSTTNRTPSSTGPSSSSYASSLRSTDTNATPFLTRLSASASAAMPSFMLRSINLWRCHLCTGRPCYNPFCPPDFYSHGVISYCKYCMIPSYL